MVVITLNAENDLSDCLASVAPVADEIIVLDSFSTDATESIARKFGARFSQRKPDSLIEQIRTAVRSAQYPWVFCIDQDERATGELRQAIAGMKRAGFNHDGYFVNRLIHYLGDWFTRCGWYPDSVIRLFNTAKATHGGTEPFYRVIMHQGTRIGHLPSHLLHYSYRDLTHHIGKVAHYSSLAAQEKLDTGKTRLVRAKMVLDPLYHFFRSYILKGGFRAGMRGFICSTVSAFYVFCKYAKVWEGLEERKRRPAAHP